MSESSIDIRAAGRMLSGRNAGKLQQIHELSGEILRSAGLISDEELRITYAELIELEPEDASAATDLRPSKSPSKTKLEAGKLANEVEVAAWRDRLRLSLKGFYARFNELVTCSDSDLKNWAGVEPGDRESEIEVALDDLQSLLGGLMRSAKSSALQKSDGRGYFPHAHPLDLEMSCEKLEDPDNPEDLEGSPQLVQAVGLSFQCASSMSVGTASGNRYPIEGVLFRIDEPSESSPSVGPAMPLYVSRAVAESVVDTAFGLPLDAHETLSRHSSEEIVGVIQSARIDGSDFVISASLWPWSQKRKVAAIEANRERLGMSMNANAVGSAKTIDGRKVFAIEALELLGANILLSDKATYQKTKLAIPVAASHVSDDEAETSESWAIAANAEADFLEFDSLNSVPDTDMETEMETQTQLEAMSSTLKSLSQSITGDIARIAEELSALQNRVQILAEKDAREESQIAAAKAEKEREDQQAQMRELVQAAVNEGIKQTLGNTSQPQRLTAPLSASARPLSQMPTDPAKIAIEIQLARLDGEFASCNDMQRQIQITDEKRVLMAQLVG